MSRCYEQKGLVPRLAAPLHQAPLRPDGRAHGGGVTPFRRARRHGQSRDGGPARLEEARPDPALARRPGRLGPRSGARGASTTATTRACTAASTRPRCGPPADWRDERPLRRPRAGGARVRRGGDRMPGRGLRRARRPDPAPPQRRGVRRVRRLGRPGELPVPLQRRAGAAQPGLLGHAATIARARRVHADARSPDARGRRGRLRGVAPAALRDRLPHAGQRRRRRGRGPRGVRAVAAAGRRAGPVRPRLPGDHRDPALPRRARLRTGRAGDAMRARGCPSPSSSTSRRAVEQADSLSLAFLVLLEELTPLERAAYLLHDIFGYSFDEVARSLGAVARRLPPARRSGPTGTSRSGASASTPTSSTVAS